MRMRAALGVLALAASLACAASPASARSSGARSRTWYVLASAAGGGNGSQQRPFATLAAVQRASGPGDTILVLPSPPGVAALDGGIALKPDQKLLGGGPRVTGLGEGAPAPRITNTGTADSGDAIELANGDEVSNIVVAGAYRGGIYGSDVRDVTVHGNDLSATNTSCTTGFVVQPFNLPTMAPGVGVPFSSGLPNGWAAIMLDESHTTTSVTVDGNVVHDAGCADGIDVRSAGTADVTARVDDNTVTRLRQGPSQQSVLAIGMQTRDTARLDARLAGNNESYIGTATAGDFGQADSEGLFANSAGRSHLIEHADHNTFAHGLGHISANCVEIAASNGGPMMNVALTNSTCGYVVGDILEAADLSKDATMTFDIDHVLAAHSTFVGAQASTEAEPGDDGDCLLEVASGAASTTSVSIENSRFTDCVADGLGVVSNVVDGTGPIKKLGFDVRNSAINANQTSNLRVANATPVSQLDGKVEHTDLSGSAGTNVILEDLDTTGGIHAALDLGGGALGSQGHNCIYGAGQTDVTTLNYNLDAKQDWWGSSNGPGPGANLMAGGTIDYDPPLSTPACGPTTRPTTTAATQPPAACAAPRRLVVDLPPGWRRATVLIAGRRAHVRRIHGRLVAIIELHRPIPRVVNVRANGINVHGQRVRLLKRYRVCRRAR
jgi:hypothetical protein